MFFDNHPTTLVEADYENVRETSEQKWILETTSKPRAWSLYIFFPSVGGSKVFNTKQPQDWQKKILLKHKFY
jgi:hypothetical protein